MSVWIMYSLDYMCYILQTPALWALCTLRSYTWCYELLIPALCLSDMSDPCSAISMHTLCTLCNNHAWTQYSVQYAPLTTVLSVTPTSYLCLILTPVKCTLDLCTLYSVQYILQHSMALCSRPLHCVHYILLTPAQSAVCTPDPCTLFDTHSWFLYSVQHPVLTPSTVHYTLLTSAICALCTPDTCSLCVDPWPLHSAKLTSNLCTLCITHSWALSICIIYSWALHSLQYTLSQT